MKKEQKTPELGLWEIAVLTLLRQGPMHPYLMRRLLKERHKDEVLALKAGSLYHAIGRLERAGLIAVEATERAGKRPERTTYRITADGEAELLRVLKKIIATPRHEPGEFMAAMSFLVHLAPEEAMPRLEERVRLLLEEITRHDALLKLVGERVPRIHLIESEYLLTMQRAEVEWIRRLIQDLRAGELSWDVESILRDAGREAERELEE
jgi:DNA-binding PadR family transcriptional regulator